MRIFAIKLVFLITMVSQVATAMDPPTPELQPDEQRLIYFIHISTDASKQNNWLTKKNLIDNRQLFEYLYDWLPDKNLDQKLMDLANKGYLHTWQGFIKGNFYQVNENFHKALNNIVENIITEKIIKYNNRFGYAGVFLEDFEIIFQDIDIQLVKNALNRLVDKKVLIAKKLFKNKTIYFYSP